MNNCPNEEELACYFDGLLPEGEVRRLEKHLLECDRCGEIVEVTRKVIEETSNLSVKREEREELRN